MAMATQHVDMAGTLPDDQVTLGEIDTDTGTDSDSEGARYCVIIRKPTRTELGDAASSCLAHAAQLVDGGMDAADRASLASNIKSGEIDLSPDAHAVPGGGLAVGIAGRDHVDNGLSVTEHQDDIKFVVVDNLATLGATIKEIHGRVDRVVSAGAELHVTDTGVLIDSDTADAVLGVLDGLDRAGVALQRDARIDDVRDWLDGRDPSVGGRAPLGFRWEDGELVTVDEFDQIRAVLDLVDVGEMSKRHAADRLGTSPRTVTRALSADRRRLYGLD